MQIQRYTYISNMSEGPAKITVPEKKKSFQEKPAFAISFSLFVRLLSWLGSLIKEKMHNRNIFLAFLLKLKL